MSKLSNLTAREQSRIPKNKITSRRTIAKMKMHLNLRQTMNFIVLKGFVNQKNDVSGRLLSTERHKRLQMLMDEMRRNSEKYTITSLLNFFQNSMSLDCVKIFYFGASSLGFMFGSSRPFPAGLSSISFSFTISSVISTLPWRIERRMLTRNENKQTNKLQTVLRRKHTPSTCFPSCSLTHGHQPRTALWEKRELGCGFLEEAEWPIPGNIFRLHFSGVFAGGIRLSRSSSTEPVTNIKEYRT